MAHPVKVLEDCGEHECVGDSGRTETDRKKKLAIALRDLAECCDEEGCDDAAAEWREAADLLDPPTP